MSIHMTANNRIFAVGFIIAVALLGPATLPSVSASSQDPGQCAVDATTGSASVECVPVERSPWGLSPEDVAKDFPRSGGPPAGGEISND
jgi:hypothetical protein